MPHHGPSGRCLGTGWLIDSGKVNPHHILAILGKTEGNGGVNDFTRGYFTQSMMALLAGARQQPAANLLRTIPCILSGGTEGVLTRIIRCFVQGRGCHRRAVPLPLAQPSVRRWNLNIWDGEGHCEAIRKAVLQAMENAGITHPDDVCLVQVKAPV